jgi:probable F420-dependent oxidoreductase
MDFGISLPTRGPLATKADIETLVRKAEALGFAYVTISDHILIPRQVAPEYPYAADGRLVSPVNWMEQLTVMAWVAAVSDKLRLLTSVMVVPHRNPVHTAKILATIDVLSGGRVTLGCGAGWMREEFEAIGTEPFDERGKVTDEYIKAFRELWTAPEPAFAGDYVSFKDIYFEPKPVQPGGIPIWIGGESGPALRRAAMLGDGWYPIGGNPKFPLATAGLYAAATQKLEAMAEAAGRDPATIERSFVANWPETGGPFQLASNERFLCTGSPDQVAEDIGTLARLGVRHMMFNFLSPTLSESLERTERFAREVMPKVSG